MSKDDIEKAIADAEAKIEAAGPVVVPDWVTDPVDREMVRRGRARVVPVVSQTFVTDEWIAGNGPDCDGWEVRDNGRTDAERLYDKETRREIADHIEAERKAEINARRGRKKKTAVYDKLVPLAKGREKREKISLWQACHDVTKGRDETGKRLYDRILEKRRSDKG